MSKGRLEAFSDGVFAIIITIIILLFDVPEQNDINALKELFPLFIVYLVSFIMIGTNWANHHHLMQVASHVNGKIILIESKSERIQELTDYDKYVIIRTTL